MGDLPNSAPSLSSASVASPLSSSSFLESSRSLSSMSISCLSSLSLLEAAVSRPCHERDVLAIGGLLTVSVAEEAAFFIALLLEKGSLFSCKCSVRQHLRLPCTMLGSGVLGWVTWVSVNCGIAGMGTEIQGHRQCV